MLLTEQEVRVPFCQDTSSLLEYFERNISERLHPDVMPVRFAVTGSDTGKFCCEVGVVSDLHDPEIAKPSSIFEFVRRDVANSSCFNAVMIVPTGIGAEIGGHAGDATPVARLLASICDTLITHPNVVNASDINELPDNGLYVEGSVISRLLMGTLGLQRVRSNRVLLVIDEHEDRQVSELAINAASAARVTLGLDCRGVVKIDPPIHMRADYSSSGTAVGQVDGVERLIAALWHRRSEFDAVAIASKIGMADGLKEEYFRSNGGITNPWGGVEAMLTHTVSMLLNVPSAHAPMVDDMDEANAVFGIVDPRMSAEAVSSAFLHCILKGLYRSPRIVTDRTLFMHPEVLTAADISCLVIPDGCVGLPTLAAMEQGIPVIAVRENRNRMRNDLRELPFAPGKLFVVENYLEAAGIMAALKGGVAVETVRRPLRQTHVSVASTRAQSKRSGEASTATPGIALMRE